MFELRQTHAFTQWINGLRDISARLRIVARLRRVEHGNFGDLKAVGEGVRELRIDHGPGYRVYFVQRGPDIVILLCGGDKRSQQADIAEAQRLAREV
ncbi:type II toxin-antitoxin system RelE/ParE family toxin [Bosea sp. 685]|uniref:type II toxin-antitoxin system RelE/ParE family toxin n=1 Tax=Bosea sp. 685 TaxID=3080057 RepID=UPI002892A2D4|nr:type II toxin-antitoxin system RelE/ParE family toxin [Bosea sp. 685]WNJ94074.1 type II toxin-antitoxin system RelE/ParE family toxin [Bosea sp. 685]